MQYAVIILWWCVWERMVVLRPAGLCSHLLGRGVWSQLAFIILGLGRLWGLSGSWTLRFLWVEVAGFFFQFKVHQMMKKQCQSPDLSALIAWACTYVLRLCMWVCSSRGGCEDVLMWRFVELTARRVSQTEGPWTILCCAYPYCFSGADPSEKSWRRQKEAIHIVQVIRSLMSCYKIGRKPNYHYKRIKVGNKVTEVFMFCLVSAP